MRLEQRRVAVIDAAVAFAAARDIQTRTVLFEAVERLAQSEYIVGDEVQGGFEILAVAPTHERVVGLMATAALAERAVAKLNAP